MLNCILKHKQKGTALIEFALIVPVFLALVIGLTQMEWLYQQRIALQTGVDAALAYARRLTPATLSGQNLTTLENLIKTGTANPNAPYLTSIWTIANCIFTQISPITINQLNAAGSSIVIHGVKITVILHQYPSFIDDNFPFLIISEETPYVS